MVKFFASLLLSVWISAVWCAVPSTINWDFSKFKRSPLKISPLTYQPCSKMAGTGAERCWQFSLPKVSRTVSAYFHYKIPPKTGSMTLKINYRATNPIKTDLKFCLEGKGNGSAGFTSLQLPAAGDFRQFSQDIEIPNQSVRVQLILVLPKSERQQLLEIRSMQIIYSADQVAVPVATPAADRAPSRWSKYAKLGTFYDSNSGETARVQTEVRMCFDQQNLYFGYIAFDPDIKSLKADSKTRDKGIWMDDCLELFITEPNRMLVRQFGVNPIGTVFDSQLNQAQAGDPWQSDIQWNSDKWCCKVFRRSDRWEASFTIPWSVMELTGPGQLRLNFARERSVDKGLSSWNAYVGKFNEVDKYAAFDPAAKVITRYRNLEPIQLIPKRTRTVFKEVLKDKAPTSRRAGFWVTGFIPVEYPAALQKKYSDADFARWQQSYYEACAAAGSNGPMLPWAAMRLSRKQAIMEEFAKKDKVTSIWYLGNSSIHGAALKLAPDNISFPHGNTTSLRTDPASPAYGEAFVNAVHRIADNPSNADLFKLTWIFLGIDEPTNNVNRMYSRTVNPAMKVQHDAADADIRRRTGFGKYGLPDFFGAKPADPLERIAFWRWWNLRLAENLKNVQAAVTKRFPGIPFLGYNSNTTAGVGNDDPARLAAHLDMTGCDPYPTSTASSFGFARAMYHTGFSTKRVHDLAPNAKCVTMPQGFVYHGRRPEPQDMREWASQALKNGADLLVWYVSGPAVLTMNKGFNYILNLNREINRLPDLKIPASDAAPAALYWSDYDIWALADNIANAQYVIYSILAEALKNEFRFVSATQMQMRKNTLDKTRIIFAPRMRYVSLEVVEQMKRFVSSGGRLVITDPEFLSLHIDGSRVPWRKELLRGAVMSPRPGACGKLYFKKSALPVSADTRLSPNPNGYDWKNLPSDAEVIAEYDDGKPAIIAVRYGKGTVVLSGIQPFGKAAAAVRPEGWEKFLAAELAAAKAVKTAQIWDFMLPEPAMTIQLDAQIK